MRRPLRHPSREELLAFAESLVDSHVTVQARVAAHVNRCPRCSEEVRGFRASLTFTASASELEPSKDLAAQILLAAQQQKERRRAWPWPAPVRAARVLGVVIVLALGGVCWFRFMLGMGAGAISELAGGSEFAATGTTEPGAAVAEPPRPEELQALAESVKLAPGKPLNDRERYLRSLAASAADDLGAARDVRRRYPGLARAAALERASLDAQRQAFRALFLYQELPPPEPATPDAPER